MPRLRIRIVATGLAVCLLVLSAVMYPQTVAHAAHHAHHKAATHSTALCTWMCAAGQAQELVSFDVQIEIKIARLDKGLFAPQPVDLCCLSPTTRGPPSFLL